MMQIVEQNDEEKFEMYMKSPKEDLAKMLIQANKTIDSILEFSRATNPHLSTLPRDHE